MRAAVSWMDHPDFAATCLPLLEEGLVEAIEWSIDTAWEPSQATAAILDHFAERDALYGHGVTLSTLSATWTPRQDAWIRRVQAEVARRPYRHISEHLGFITAGDWVDGAPLPMPRLPQVVEAGRRSVARLGRATGGPVGLENLALALSADDVRDEGDLLEAILAPTDGFIVLDLHNLWCRAVNFDQPLPLLLERYPAERVREVHLSGGSWDGTFRRDTHDGAVPDEVFAALPDALHRFANVEVVVLEQLPGALGTPEQRDAFEADFRRLRQVLHG